MQVNILAQEQGMAKVQVLIPGSALTAVLDELYATQKKNHPEFTVAREDLASAPEAQELFRSGVQEVFSDNYAEAIEATGLVMASEPTVGVLQASEQDGLEFQLEFAVRPEVHLGQYKGIHVKMPDYALTEEEYQAALLEAAQQNVQPKDVDRPAQLGDTALIDFTGYLDGVPFDGGAGTDYPLSLGSGTFIPGFEEQLVGASVGDNVIVNVTFPDAYPAENLAGKATMFRVKIKKLQMPELQALTEEQKESVRQQAQQRKKDLADQEIEDQVLDRILSEAGVKIPAAMLSSEINSCMEQFAAELNAKGMDIDTFCQQTGKTTAQMAEEMAPMASRRIMLRLVLSAIAEAEGFTATDEEVEAQWEKMAQQYGIDVPRLKIYAGEGAEASIRAEITASKAYTLLRESTILEME